MTKDPNAVILGKKGGTSTNNKYGSDHFKRISKLGVEARRAKRILPIDKQPTA